MVLLSITNVKALNLLTHNYDVKEPLLVNDLLMERQERKKGDSILCMLQIFN